MESISFGTCHNSSITKYLIKRWPEFIKKSKTIISFIVTCFSHSSIDEWINHHLLFKILEVYLIFLQEEGLPCLYVTIFQLRKKELNSFYWRTQDSPYNLPKPIANRMDQSQIWSPPLSICNLNFGIFCSLK